MRDRIRHFVMGASHDKCHSRGEADEKLIDAFNGYVSNGAGCASLKFQRSEDGIDENKFLMPFCRQLKVPVMVPQVLNALENGLNVTVAGSTDIGVVVNFIKDIFPEYKPRLAWAHEGRYNLSLANSITRGIAEAKRNGLGNDEHFWWVPLDVPFFHAVQGMVTDKDALRYKCVVDFNSKEVIFGDKPELFPRNYYHKLQKTDGTVVSFKESNAYALSADLDFGFVNKLYSNRHAGSMGPGFVARNLVPRIIRDIFSDGGLERLALMMRPLVSNLPKLRKSAGRIVYVQTLESLGYPVFYTPIKVKAEHTDPFRMKDIDAWHDLWFYHHLVDHAEQKYGSLARGLDAIHPMGERIIYFNERAGALAKGIPVLGNFAEYAYQRFRTFRGYGLEVPMPIDLDGNLLVGPAPGEMIGESVNLLERMRQSQ